MNGILWCSVHLLIWIIASLGTKCNIPCGLVLKRSPWQWQVQRLKWLTLCTKMRQHFRHVSEIAHLIYLQRAWSFSKKLLWLTVSEFPGTEALIRAVYRACASLPTKDHFKKCWGWAWEVTTKSKIGEKFNCAIRSFWKENTVYIQKEPFLCEFPPMPLCWLKTQNNLLPLHMPSGKRTGVGFGYCLTFIKLVESKTSISKRVKLELVEGISWGIFRLGHVFALCWGPQPLRNIVLWCEIAYCLVGGTNLCFEHAVLRPSSSPRNQHLATG